MDKIPQPSANPASRIIDGFRIPLMFSEESFRSALNYKPRSDDVFIVTYPKCGTTWSQHTLTLIFRQGEPLASPMDFFSAAPFLEMTGAKATETMPRPGAIKTHLPFHLNPWSEDAKYIYVTRNPKDTCVSYFHHMRNIPGHAFNGTFDQFFELFISGNIDYGDFFDHLLEWYEHRNEPNVLFVTYEEMKKDPKAAVLKMASFIDDEKFAEPLRRDLQKLNNVLQFSSFKHMKEVVNESFDALFQMPKEETEKANLPEAMKQLLLDIGDNKEKDKTQPRAPVNFVRKGIVGDWRNYFSEEQSKRMDEKLADKLKGTEFADFWKDYI